MQIFETMRSIYNTARELAYATEYTQYDANGNALPDAQPKQDHATMDGYHDEMLDVSFRHTRNILQGR